MAIHMGGFPGEGITAEQFRSWLMDAAKVDGQLTKEELREFLSSLGLHFKRWKVWRAMKHADLDRNQRINGDREYRELVSYACKRWGIIVDSNAP